MTLQKCGKEVGSEQRECEKKGSRINEAKEKGIVRYVAATNREGRSNDVKDKIIRYPEQFELQYGSSVTVANNQLWKKWANRTYKNLLTILKI